METNTTYFMSFQYFVYSLCENMARLIVQIVENNSTTTKLGLSRIHKFNFYMGMQARIIENHYQFK